MTTLIPYRWCEAAVLFFGLLTALFLAVAAHVQKVREGY